MKDLLNALNATDDCAVCLLGEGDIAEVRRLTCLEHHVALKDDIEAPALVVNGLDIRLAWR